MIHVISLFVLLSGRRPNIIDKIECFFFFCRKSSECFFFPLQFGHWSRSIVGRPKKLIRIICKNEKGRIHFHFAMFNESLSPSMAANGFRSKSSFTRKLSRVFDKIFVDVRWNWHPHTTHTHKPKLHLIRLLLREQCDLVSIQ